MILQTKPPPIPGFESITGSFKQIALHLGIAKYRGRDQISIINVNMPILHFLFKLIRIASHVN